MADQALDVNKIFASIGKESQSSSIANESISAEKTVADLFAEAQETQAENHAKQQKIDDLGIAEARETISDLYRGMTDIETIATNGLEQQTVKNDQEAAAIVDIEALATKLPEKPVAGAENTAEVTAFSQETQSLYDKKAQDERALKNEQEIAMTDIEVVATKLPEKTVEAGINELVINGIKQNVENEKTIAENLGKNPEQALTWRAWWSEKLRKMWRIFAQQEKN